MTTMIDIPETPQYALSTMFGYAADHDLGKQVAVVEVHPLVLTAHPDSRDGHS